MASVTELRQAVAALLARLEADVLVYPGKTDYGARPGALEKLHLTVRVLVGPEVSENGRERLDAMLAPEGPASVKALLDRDDTLGGLVADARVTGASGYRTFLTQDGPQLGCEWTVEIVP